MKMTYPVLIESDPEGGYVATFPDVPGAIAGGPSRAAAMLEARAALGVMLCEIAGSGEPVPAPGRHQGLPRLAPHASDAVKVALIEAFRDAGISKTELARRLARTETEARRILDPHHPTKLPLMEQALAALGRTLVIETRAA